jgi:hypothetical protein
MSRWADLFNSLLSETPGTPLTPDNKVSQAVIGVAFVGNVRPSLAEAATPAINPTSLRLAERPRITARGTADAPRPVLLLVHPPRFVAPARWWAAARTGWCTGCGGPSTWRTDPPPAPSPSVRWRCTRCASNIPGDRNA